MSLCNDTLLLNKKIVFVLKDFVEVTVSRIYGIASLLTYSFAELCRTQVLIKCRPSFETLWSRSQDNFCLGISVKTKIQIVLFLAFSYKNQLPVKHHCCLYSIEREVYVYKMERFYKT